MSNVVQFNFEQTYKEIEIGDKLYRMDMNDDAQAKVQELFGKANKFATEAKKLDTENMTTEELKAMSAEQKELGIEIVETFLGEGAGIELYEKAGRSTINMMKLGRQLQVMFEDFMGESYEDEKKKFTKKGK